MPLPRDITPPLGDSEYFERMTKCIFRAGLNWRVVEKKWPGFRRAFADFEPSKVARFSGADIRKLKDDEGIVRNERKIAATVNNAAQFLSLREEFGSFRNYLDSFGGDERRLQGDLQERFSHLGPSTARMFLWTAGCKLTPTPEEKRWIAEHRGSSD
jgi:3-methyladenine DNA glycosylase Tag